MELAISVLSEAGGRGANEDAYGVWSAAGACFCVLSDGAGGHAAGAAASKLAVESVLDCCRRTPEPAPPVLAAALEQANAALVARRLEAPGRPEMRATVLVLALDTVNATACWAHLGDTRLYCFRGGRIVVQTRDHSVVQGMVEAGYLAPADLRAAPGRNVLLGALGDATNFAPRVQVTPFPLRDGDIFLLCTDGLWEHVDETVMERLLRLAPSAAGWLGSMEQEVLRHAPANADNYSALAVLCREPGARAGAPGNG
ncbi:MAG: protein phosphatase 2C domain-containing protein [Telluria sp.]